MVKVRLELIRDAFKASLLPPSSKDRECYKCDDEECDVSDGDSFYDALTDLPKDTLPSETYKEDFVNASDYTKAYAEIACIFDHMNMAFAFVGQNLRDSCALINTVITKHDKETVSLEEALKYDEQVNFQYGIVSCVLWLHRPLEFIIRLFKNFIDSSEENVVEIAKSSYLSTLGQHHAWPIQQMVNVLFQTLPTKSDMMNTMHYETEEQTYELLLEVVDAAQPVYDRIQKMVERLKLQ